MIIVRSYWNLVPEFYRGNNAELQRVTAHGGDPAAGGEIADRGHEAEVPLHETPGAAGDDEHGSGRGQTAPGAQSRQGQADAAHRRQREGTF